MELAHLPYKNGKTNEDYIGVRGLHRMGKKKWRCYVVRIVKELKAALNADYVVLGGGNVKKMNKPFLLNLCSQSEGRAGNRLAEQMIATIVRSTERLWDLPNVLCYTEPDQGRHTSSLCVPGQILDHVFGQQRESGFALSAVIPV